MHGACEMNIRKGAVKGNTIVFDEPLGLPDGEQVNVDIHLADDERERADAAANPPFRVKPNKRRLRRRRRNCPLEPTFG